VTRSFLWNEHAELLTKPLATALMDLRREDGDNDLLMDPVTLAELTEEADRMLAIDGIVAQYNELEHVAGQMEMVMKRASGTVKPIAKQISDPFTQYGVLQVVLLFELSDGQTISVYFHNPDTTPKKIKATDELVSWKWLLNKKDVTILVAPEQGKELNVREVARRIMKAAEKNSAAFVRNNAKRSERLRAIESLKTEIAELETECKDLERQIDEARARQEELSVAAHTERDETAPDTPDLDRDAIARVDAAYHFEHASDEFKEWLAESLDNRNHSPFVTAREMDKRAKANGATIEWGFFNGSALDSVDVDEGDEDWDDEESAPDQDTALLFDSNPNWRRQPRERRTGRWRQSRRRQLAAAGKKAGRAVAKAARQASSYVTQALKGNNKTGRLLHGAVNALGNASQIDPGIAAINELAGGIKAIKGIFDSVQSDYVGKIRKDGEIVGRVDMDDDGKAMVFVGEEGSERVSIPGKPEISVVYSDDDAPDMVDWLFAGLAGSHGDIEPQPTGGNEPGQRAALETALQELIDHETNIDRYDAELDRIANLAEAAGLMEVLDAKLNEAADKLTVLLNEEAARAA